MQQVFFLYLSQRLNQSEGGELDHPSGQLQRLGFRSLNSKKINVMPKSNDKNSESRYSIGKKLQLPKCVAEDFKKHTLRSVGVIFRSTVGETLSST